MTIEYLILLFALLLWCILHSALITTRFVEAQKKRLGQRFRYYRLVYNVIAAATLVPLYLLIRSTPAVAIYEWSGWWRILQYTLLAAGLYLLYAGSKVYDGQQFLGLRQIRSNNHDIGLSESGGLHTAGILNVTQHPWYLAGLLVLWARDIDSASLVVNVIFSLYLIIGAKIEEKKLVREFGTDYIEYQSRVSMLFPVKWITSVLRKT